MKTKEFIERVENLGFKVSKRSALLIVAEPNYLSEVVTVRIDKMYHLDSRWDHSALDKEILEKALSYTVQYARTPLEEREEEKKYRYEFPFNITAKNVETKHICRNHTFRESGESDQLIIDLSPMDCVAEDEYFHFTNKEVEEYTGKDRSLFDACKKFEVTP